jgi:type III secretion protein T
MLEAKALEELFKPMLMLLPRIFAVFVVFPMLSNAALQGWVRNGIVLGIGCVLYPHVAAAQPTAPLSALAWTALAAKEVFIGLVIGFVVSIFLWVVENVGQLIDFQTGSSNASVFDPLTGHESGPTARFLLQLVSALFLASGGFLTLLGLLFDSYKVWPVFSFYPELSVALQSFLLQQTDSLMVMTVKLAAPIVLILVVAELGLGLVNRFAPQLNVFMLAQPIKGALAIFMLAMFLTFLFDSLKNFLGPDRLIMQTLRGVF